MRTIELTVAKATKTESGNFCNKLVAEQTVQSAFGNVSSRQTYYMFTDQKNEVGFKAELDLDDYDIVESEFKPEDSDDTIMLKKLYPKR